MEGLQSLSASWFHLMVGITVKTSFVLVIAFLVNSIWRKLSASVKHFIWFLAIVSVLIVPVLTYFSEKWDVTICFLGQSDLQMTGLDSSPYSKNGNSLEKVESANPASTSSVGTMSHGTRREDTTTGESVFSAFFKGATAQTWLAVFWVLGMSVFVFRFVFGAVKIKKNKKGFLDTENPEFSEILREMTQRLQIKRTVDIRFTRNQNMPATFGVFKPTIFLPHDAAEWSDNQKRSIIIHELAHIKRFDFLFNVLAYAVHFVFWFNPIVWYAAKRQQGEAEHACDDIVVSNGIRPTVYAHYLIDSARLLLKQKYVSPFETAIAKKSSLESRILSVIDEKRTRKAISRKIAIWSVFAAAVFAVVAACTRFEEKNYTAETIDGVEHIQNLFPKFKDKPKFKLDFVWKIGDLEEKNENYQFYNAFDATMDKDRNVYVMDSGNCRIQVFGPEGNYLKTIGREGQGPGEFQQLFSMDINEIGDLCVYDRGKRSVEIFDRTGMFMRSSRLQGNYSYIRITGPDRFCAPLIDVLYPDLMIMRQAYPGRKDSREVKCLSSVSLLDETKKEFCFGLPEEGITNGSQINANIFETDDQLNLYVAFKHQNRIEKYTPDGRLLFTVKRPLNDPVEYKTAERIWRSGGYQEAFPEFAGTYVSERIGIDGSGRIWVETYTGQPVKDEGLNVIKPGPKVFEVFSHEGVLLTRIPYPDDNIRFIRLKENHLLFADKEYITIHLFRIVGL